VKLDILLAKFKYYGINEKAGDLMKSYLNDRYQKVIKNEYSKIVPIGAMLNRVYHKVQCLDH
jgi:hypothetical protein